jgi:hypothetical protein
MMVGWAGPAGGSKGWVGRRTGPKSKIENKRLQK